MMKRGTHVENGAVSTLQTELGSIPIHWPRLKSQRQHGARNVTSLSNPRASAQAECTMQQQDSKLDYVKREEAIITQLADGLPSHALERIGGMPDVLPSINEQFPKLFSQKESIVYTPHNSIRQRSFSINPFPSVLLSVDHRMRAVSSSVHHSHNVLNEDLDSIYIKSLKRAGDAAESSHTDKKLKAENPVMKKKNGTNRRLCQFTGCAKWARRGGTCIMHGGGSRCKVQDCEKSIQSGGYCYAHGGGKRCKETGCSRAVKLEGRCNIHAEIFVSANRK